MDKKRSALWDFIFELYGIKITIYMVLAGISIFKIVTLALGFFPPEYQNSAFLILCCAIGIVIAVVLYAIVEAPSFIMSFFRGR